MTSRSLAYRFSRQAFGTSALVGVLFLVVASGAAALETKTDRYTPFDTTGEIRSDLNVTDLSGECWTSSSILGRDGAWRCVTGNSLRDPCFESPIESDILICARSPWDTSVVRLEASLDYDDFWTWKGGSWALKLTNGTKCHYVTGATTAVKGRRLNYFCGKNGKGPYLFGNPDKSSALWRIRMSKSPSGRGMRRVGIRLVVR